MDPADSKASELERRNSRRPSARVSVLVQGDDDDLYLQAAGVSDGFRPNLPDLTPSLGNSSRSSYLTDDDSESRPSTPRQANLTALPARPSRPSSIAKPPGASDSFTLRYDGAMGPLIADGTHGAHGAHDSPTSIPSLVSRVSSVSTTASPDATPPIRHENPYDGPSGPSHPYQMYPQNVRLARTLSVTTSSTSEPMAVSEQPYAGPRGPAHPYGMYPQNTVPVAEQNAIATAPESAPVGFPGVGTHNYQRRLGPDGEEIADIIGPDGHTEQLPPYTRYPDETYTRKVRDAEAGEGPSSSSPSTPVPGPATVVSAAAAGPSGPSGPAGSAPLIPQPIAGAGGMGLAARNPEFDSTDDLHSPRSRHSSRSFTSTSDASHHEINTAAAAVISEKRPPKRWQRAGNRRLFGIVPCWAILLTTAVLLTMGVIMGAVVGTFVTKQNKGGRPPHDGEHPQPQLPTMYDATPIPVPSDLPDLPLGSFGMPVMVQRAPNLCFNETTQAQAWTCNIIFGFGALMMSINREGQGSSYSISMSTNESLTISNNQFNYGAQPPLLKGTHSLQMVNDTLEPSRGPAWFKMMPFNKTVILPEGSLSVTPTSSASRHRRGYGSAPPFGPPSDYKRKYSAQPGEKPWVCTWPDTLLEIFIYPNQNTSFSKISTNAGGSSSSNSGGSGGGSSNAASQTGSPTRTGSVPSETAGTRATPSPTPSGFPGLDELGPPPPPYPRVVKLEERRLRDSPPVMCRQLRIEADGSARPNLSSDGKPIELLIAETVSGPNTPPKGSSGDSGSGSRRRWEDAVGGLGGIRHPLAYAAHQLMPRDGPDLSDCGCLWFMT